MISFEEMGAKIENRIYPGRWKTPCKDVQVTLTKEFCEDIRKRRQHYLFMMVLALAGAFSFFGIGMLSIYFFHIPEIPTMTIVGSISMVIDIFGVIYGAAWATTMDFGKDIDKLIKEEKK